MESGVWDMVCDASTAFKPEERHPYPAMTTPSQDEPKGRD